MNKLKRVFITCLYLVSMASIVCHAHDENIASLMQQLEQFDVDVETSASKALIEIGEAAVPALIVGLNHEIAFVREKVVRILHEIGDRAPHNKDIVRALAKALKDDDREVRERIMWRFKRYSELPPEIISGLVQLLYYGSPFYDPGASSVLLSVGSRVRPEGAAALIEALHSSEWSLRFGAAFAYSFGSGHRHLDAEFRNKEGMPPSGVPAPPGITKKVVSTLVEGLTHPDWGTRELVVMRYLQFYTDDFDEARKALEALPPFGIISQTIRNGEDVSDSVVLDSLNTDGITFKFNRAIWNREAWTRPKNRPKITIQPVDGEPLGWTVELSSHSTITITPPEGKELVRGQRYTIQLRDVKDVLWNHVGADIEFTTAVPR